MSAMETWNGSAELIAGRDATGNAQRVSLAETAVRLASTARVIPRTPCVQRNAENAPWSTNQ